MENCLTYALRTWRMGRPSDHLVIRRSHWGWFPHFAVVFEMEPRPRWLPPLFFKGVEKITYYRRSYVIDGRTNH